MQPELWRPLAERFNLQPALLSEIAAYNLAFLPTASAAMLQTPAETLDGQAPPGIAVIPIAGTLIANHDRIGRYMTGYDAVTRAVQTAAADPAVRGIALLVDSHGGQLAGCMDCADAIAQANAVKPVWALAKHAALSAGYALASAAGRLYGTTSSQLGSVGVVLAHMDISKALDAFGINVTLLHAGARKVDGHPFGPLPDPTRDALQAELDDARQAFAGRVALHRGLKADAVLATEAATLVVDEAVRLGLADGIVSQEAFFTAFGNFLGASSGAPRASSSNRSRGVQHMSDQAPGGATPELQNLPTAMASEQLREARSAGAAAERARIAAILQSDEAKGREAQALHVALQTDMAADAARSLLATFPEVAAGSPLERAMAGDPLPMVGAGSDSPTPGVRRIRPPGEIYSARAASVAQHHARN